MTDLSRQVGGVPPVWCHPWGTIWEAKSAPKRSKKRSQNETKNQEAKKTAPRRSWARLGAILGRLERIWGRLGLQNRALALGGARFFENRLFEENEGSRGDLGRFGVDLGRTRGVKMRAAEGQKRSYVEMILSSEVEVKLR